MCKRNFRKLTSLLLVMCLLLTLFPSGVIAASEAGTQTDTFQLDADCRILNYVHESVFNQADHVERLPEDETYGYHWYRQNSDGSWSHKPGDGAVINTDYLGNVIWDPEEADSRNPYDPAGVDYSVFCGYYYVSAVDSMYDHNA